VAELPLRWHFTMSEDVASESKSLLNVVAEMPFRWHLTMSEDIASEMQVFAKHLETIHLTKIVAAVYSAQDEKIGKFLGNLSLCLCRYKT
jgi:hypothetical protein